MFTQFGDIYVHTAGVEIIVIDPNGFQREISFQDFVYMSAKQAQQFRVGSSYFFGIVLQMGVLGIWIGMFVDWGARSALFGWRFLSGKWLQRKALA